MVEVVRYSPRMKKEWDEFVRSSKNGVFLFMRDYMEYHSDRFDDHSLMVYSEDRKLISIMPANINGDTVTSHGGLTFGGLLFGHNSRASRALKIADSVFGNLKQEGVKQVIYKEVPHIYHTSPAEEGLYIVFRYNGKLIRRDISATITLSNIVNYTKQRRWSVKKAKSNGVNISISDDFVTFMTIEEDLLKSKYGKRPVHTDTELELLASRFPDNIKLFAADISGEMLGGVVIYESQNVAHCQYIASTERGRNICAVDLILDHLIREHYRAKHYFDFGISTEDEGRYLNLGLSDYKSGFGAGSTVYDTYEVRL